MANHKVTFTAIYYPSTKEETFEAELIEPSYKAWNFPEVKHETHRIDDKKYKDQIFIDGHYYISYIPGTLKKVSKKSKED